MKKLLFFICVLALSCQEKNTKFTGLGDIKIGGNFASISNSTAFRKIMDGEFYADRFKLSDEIGFVSDLNVSTSNDKISEVKFSNTEDTNVAEIEKFLENLEQVKLKSPFPKGFNVKEFSLDLYHTNDKQIFFAVEKHNDKKLNSGKPLYEFSYISKEALMQNHASTMKTIGIK